MQVSMPFARSKMLLYNFDFQTCFDAICWVSRWRWPGILIIFEDDMSVHLYDLLNNQHFDVRFLWVFPVFLKDFNRYHDHFMAEEQE